MRSSSRKPKKRLSTEAFRATLGTFNIATVHLDSAGATLGRLRLIHAAPSVCSPAASADTSPPSSNSDAPRRSDP